MKKITSVKDKTKQKGSKRSKLPFYKREGFQGYMFMIPTLIGFPLLCAYPILSSFYYAFCDWDGIREPVFVGLKNFQYLFQYDPIFFRSLRVTFIYVLINVPMTLILGMALAMLLNKSLPGMKVFRVIYYLPTIVPGIAAMILWQFMFKTDSGLLNGILQSIGLSPVGWLSDKNVVLLSLSMIKWWGVGGTMMIFLSGLQSVPADVYEAADLDGASGWSKFRSITFPMITPIFFLQLITGMIGCFQSFTEAQLLTEGGPNYYSHFINYDIYRTAFVDYKFGRASAEALVLFLIIMAFTGVVFKKSEQFVYYENE